MSQGLFSSDSSSTHGSHSRSQSRGAPQLPTDGPPTPNPDPGLVVPPVAAPIPPRPIDSQARTESDRDGVPVATSKPLPPPPPPPRATLPPVRQPSDHAPQQRSGIGSANTRWRGGLPEIITRPTHLTDAEQPSAPFALDAPDTHLEAPSEVAEAPESEDELETVARSAPSWLLSMVIHLIALLILALISLPPGNGFSKLVLSLGVSEDESEDAVELDISSLDSLQEEETEIDTVDDVLVETEIPDVFEIVQETNLTAIAPVLMGDQAIEIAKPMFSGRSGAMRKALMAMYGATAETEKAVEMGLAWLKRQQNKAGYWSMNKPFTNGGMSENRTAATAMAILAFAGHGNTHQGGPYKAEVEKGVKFLVGQQDRGGFMAKSARGNEKTYAQAQATIALCELYGMTKDSWLRPYAQNAIDYAQKAQGYDGGWRYQPREPGDTSVTGWYVMALQSAMASGLDVNEENVERISKYLDAASVYNGAAYSYQAGRKDATPPMTAEGLLCRQYLGWKRDHPSMIDGLGILRTEAPFDVRRQNVYYWYYATQVFHHWGGFMWKDWNDEMKVKLPSLQIKEGRERGSFPPQGDRWGMQGRLYTTCLSIYCLEVYYRHLPLYNQKE